tara:strand:- start:4185 stop:4529 length:345 start_codon:yes stop_codon:yes gene_type:complete
MSTRPTYTVKLKYQVVISDTSGRAKSDPTTNNPLIAVYIDFRGRDYLVGNISLAELKLLTGTSTEYNAVVAQTTVTDRPPTIVNDSTKNNEQFTAWAKRFPNSSLTPFLSLMHK